MSKTIIDLDEKRRMKDIKNDPLLSEIFKFRQYAIAVLLKSIGKSTDMEDYNKWVTALAILVGDVLAQASISGGGKETPSFKNLSKIIENRYKKQCDKFRRV